MLVLNYSPTPSAPGFEDFYKRGAREGMVHSAIMRGEHFGMAEDFCEDDATATVAWSCGGRETYLLDGTKPVSIVPSGVMTIASGERYAYDACADRPFRSNMILFPKWLVHEAKTDAFHEPAPTTSSSFATQLCRPGATTLTLMNAIAGLCILGIEDDTLYTEQIALLYGRLLYEQAARARAPIPAVKAATSHELARRIDRTEQFILETYGNPELCIEQMAAVACISRFHFIRVFKRAKGVTPVQYLNAVRLGAAGRLLHHSRLTIKDIAIAVGYKDRAAFVRAFKRAYGVSPSSFKMSVSS